MTTNDKNNFVDACHTVLVYAGGAYSDYAKSYAEAGLDMHDCREIAVQCLYILNNLQNWRGDQARAVKSVLRRLSKLG